MTLKAVSSGKEWALRMIAETGAKSPPAMLEALGLSLVENDDDMRGGGRPLYAQFVPERRIEIMTQPISIYSSMFEKFNNEANELFPPPAQVRELLLGHELYHYVEECHKNEIYSRTETIQLWKFLWITNNSTIRAISEIAAMSFTKTLNGISYSPFILDVLLFYGYDKKRAENVFKRIMRIAEENTPHLH
jgi:hypothetical protein